VTRFSPEIIAAAESPAHATRPGRALIGWMTPVEAQLTLAQHLKDQATRPEHVQRAASARSAVAERQLLTVASNVISSPGPELEDYIGRLRAHADFMPYAKEGWTVAVADLTRVGALQQTVSWDPAESRLVDTEPTNMQMLAALTLPIRHAQEAVPLQFDPALNTWIVNSRNPNLRIMGHFNTPIDAGDGQTYLGCGFLVAVSPSFLQVVRWRGRYLLRDGYHRSLGLLSRGVTHVPVLFRELGDFDVLERLPGMLPETSFLGERPPMLADYLSDTVSAAVRSPASHRMIVIQGLEMSPFG
jgi:hypothetical protein